MMKSTFGSSVAALFLSGLTGYGAALTVPDLKSVLKDDVQLRAMTDELARSKTLQLNNLDKPYFISYGSEYSESFSVSASLGGLLHSGKTEGRVPHVVVRVGDYAMDNTDSIYTRGARLRAWPVDTDYDLLRTELWLATDDIYKSATEQITRKRTALREAADPDKTPDLTPEKPVQLIEPAPKLEIDADRWTESVRRLSARFVSHPDVLTSSVNLQSASFAYRLVNSEGTVLRIPEAYTSVQIRAVALAPDGSHVWSHQYISAENPGQLPSEQVLQGLTDEIAQQTEALAKSPLAEDYSGPVLFEKEAAAAMMAQVLNESLRLTRKPVAPPGSRDGQSLDSVWAARMGSKVLPEWMTLVDDPSVSDFQGTPLWGGYKVDDEGVPGEKVTLVNNGVLKAFLLTRQPVKTYTKSNGHARLSGAFGAAQAAFSNLFVNADDTVTDAALKAKLLEMVKSAGLKYGMLIRRLDFPTTAPIEDLRNILTQLQKSGAARTITVPILAYRVYPDGREELVRGVRFKEFNAKDLRSIQAASDKPYVLNYLNSGGMFNWLEGASDMTTSSVVCPSLLFDSLDLAHAEDELSKPPLVPAPAMVAQTK